MKICLTLPVLFASGLLLAGCADQPAPASGASINAAARGETIPPTAQHLQKARESGNPTLSTNPDNDSRARLN